jgi:Flp pilus assembly protein TadB
MAIFIYFISIFTLWYMGRRFGKKAYLKHAVYTKVICPAVLIPMEGILKRVNLNAGSRLMFLYSKGRKDGVLKVHLAVKISSFILFACYPVVYLSIWDAKPFEIALACMMPVFGFFVPDLDLSSKIKNKKNAIMSDYPVLCTDLAVMAGAGLNLMDAWARASSRNSQSILYREARLVIQKTKAGTPLRDALKEFSANLPMPEIHTFATIISQEIKSGSGGMPGRLRECALRSWQAREDTVKKKGEEAASKIIFPLALGLAGILIILASPAVLIMKGL